MIWRFLHTRSRGGGNSTPRGCSPIRKLALHGPRSLPCRIRSETPPQSRVRARWPQHHPRHAWRNRDSIRNRVRNESPAPMVSFMSATGLACCRLSNARHHRQCSPQRQPLLTQNMGPSPSLQARRSRISSSLTASAALKNAKST